MASAALATNRPFSGLRPVHLRTDLAGMAELLELCFGATMDEAGHSAIREMRMVSQSGSLSLLFHGLDRLLGGLEQGFVWIEDGRLVGNVSVSPANYPHSMGKGFIIANVAVHPDYRGLGIAGKLYEGRLAILKRFELRRMVAGGRIPGYRRHAGRIIAHIMKPDARRSSEPFE